MVDERSRIMVDERSRITLRDQDQILILVSAKFIGEDQLLGPPFGYAQGPGICFYFWLRLRSAEVLTNCQHLLKSHFVYGCSNSNCNSYNENGFDIQLRV